MGKLYSYLDDFETAYYAELATHDIEFAKYELMFEYVQKSSEIKFMEADLRVLNENGSIEDLESYYEAEQANANAQTGGVFTGLINAIKGLLTAIINGITNIFNGTAFQNMQKDSRADSVQVTTEDPDKPLSALSALLDKAKGILTNPDVRREAVEDLVDDAKDFMNAHKKALLMIGAGAVGFAVTARTVLKGAGKSDDQNGDQNAENGAATAGDVPDPKKTNAKGFAAIGDAIKNHINNINGKLDEIAKTQTNDPEAAKAKKTFIGQIKAAVTLVTKAPARINQVIGGIMGVLKGNNNQKTPAATTTTDTTNSNSQTAQASQAAANNVADEMGESVELTIESVFETMEDCDILESMMDSI